MVADVFGIVGTTQAGTFRVEKVVAEGGFGVVYRATHTGFRAPVALKCLKVEDAPTEKQRAAFLEKFREEAEILFHLSASIPEVVRPLHIDVLKLPGGQFVPFLALEWLEGESLEQILRRRHQRGQGPMGLHKLVKLLAPLARALARAHRFPSARGVISIVHNDLKPDNILVLRKGGLEHVKILDFGIAKARSVASQAAGGAAGEDDLQGAFSPAYAAPEQWQPKTYGQTGPWTDVWGLALTMVESLSKNPPITGNTKQMMHTALDGARRPTPKACGVVVSAAVEEVFARALALHPRDRTKDVEVFWTDLERALGLPTSFAARRDGREEPSTGIDDFDSKDEASEFDLLDAAPEEPPAAEASLTSLGVAEAAAPLLKEAAPGLTEPVAPVDEEPLLAELAIEPNARSASSVARSVPPLEGGASIALAPRGSSAPLPPAQRALGRSLPPRPLGPPSPEATLVERLRMPVVLLVVALLIPLLDRVLHRALGAPLTLGPIRAYWLAGPLAVVGVGWILWRLIREGSDD